MVERGLIFSEAEIQASSFVDFYESKGWMVGKTKMKDWKASVRNWLRKYKAPDNKREQGVRDWINEGQEKVIQGEVIDHERF